MDAISVYVLMNEDGKERVAIGTEEELKDVINNAEDEGEFPIVISVIQLDTLGPRFQALVHLFRSTDEGSDFFLEELLTRVRTDGPSLDND